MKEDIQIQKQDKSLDRQRQNRKIFETNLSHNFYLVNSVIIAFSVLKNNRELLKKEL